MNDDGATLMIDPVQFLNEEDLKPPWSLIKASAAHSHKGGWTGFVVGQTRHPTPSRIIIQGECGRGKTYGCTSQALEELGR